MDISLYIAPTTGPFLYIRHCLKSFTVLLQTCVLLFDDTSSCLTSIISQKTQHYLLSFWSDMIGFGDFGSNFATWSAIAAITPALSLDALPLTKKVLLSFVLWLLYISFIFAIFYSLVYTVLCVNTIDGLLPPKQRPAWSAKMQPMTPSSLIL